MDSEVCVVVNGGQLQVNECEKNEEPDKNFSFELKEVEADETIHGFNASNITVIEKSFNPTNLNAVNNMKHTSCEGSDSGVEVLENCLLERTVSVNSTNSQEFITVTPACSYDSSIISCCSNYEEAYNVLARRNSTLLEDYKLRCDGTSEGGSESSSVIGSTARTLKRTNAASAKKKINGHDPKNKQTSAITSRSRSRPTVPKTPNAKARGKSIEQQSPKTPSKVDLKVKTPNSRLKPVPTNLVLTIPKEKNKLPSSRASSTTRTTPITTPTDDGRWPSINSKPAPSMGRSMRGLMGVETTPTSKRNNGLPEKSSAIEKYGTLPRRRKGRSNENLQDLQNKSITKDNLMTSSYRRQDSRENSTPKSLPPFPKRKVIPKTKIYHEMSIQTALTNVDIEKAFSGIPVSPSHPQDVETDNKEIQVDNRIEEIEKLREQIQTLNDCREKLIEDYKKQSETLCDVEQRLIEEINEKNGLKEELKLNTERVLAILGSDNALSNDESSSSDSLLVLESRYQKVGQIMIKQENEISELNSYCRSLQRDLDKSVSTQNILLQQQQDLESEGVELQEFMQAEKTTLSDALKEAEAEIKKLKLSITQKDSEIENKQDEAKRLVRLSEQRRQENMGLQARLGACEMQSREMLIYQGGHISSATVALSSLISRLDGLVEELVVSYSISEQELEDVIYHNEAYTNSSNSPDATPEQSKKFLKEKSPSPKRGSSFVSAIINAIKNATAQTSFSTSKDPSKDTLSLDNSDSVEMLDSETEPCLMMEPVLEDVVIPDGHSQNMISSGHGMVNSAILTHSESLNNLSQAIYQRQLSEQTSLNIAESLNASMTSNTSFTTDGCTAPLVDQVINVDNLITRLLKVLRIIQIEHDEYMNDLQDERDTLSQQVDNQKEANKVVVKQLKDWEALGAHLKSEVTELMQQLGRKNNEIDDLKSELNQHRKEIERLNEDVCALSTACQKSELELKLKQEECNEAINKWEESGEMPTKEVLANVISEQKEIPLLKEKLVEKEKQLHELKQEYVDSRHVLTENWKEAINEAKKQYDAIDSALEILHNIQSVVTQCPPLVKLQRDLEDISFQSASTLPIAPPSDCNANGALLKSVNNLGIPSPINSSA